MKKLYTIISETETTQTTSKRDMVNKTAEYTKNGIEFTVEKSIVTTNVRRLVPYGEAQVKVQTDSGKTYTTWISNDPLAFDGKEMDRERDREVRKDGKQMLFNTKAGNFQALRVIAIELDGEWFNLVKVDSNSMPRMSLAQAIEKLKNLGYEVVTSGKCRYTIEDMGTQVTRTGRELVRFAQAIQ